MKNQGDSLLKPYILIEKSKTKSLNSKQSGPLVCSVLAEARVYLLLSRRRSAHWSCPHAYGSYRSSVSLPAEPEVRREDALLQTPAAPQHAVSHHRILPRWLDDRGTCGLWWRKANWEADMHHTSCPVMFPVAHVVWNKKNLFKGYCSCHQQIPPTTN